MGGFKLDDELIETLVGYTKNGNYLSVSAAAAGIDRKTFYKYRQIGATIAELVDPSCVDIDDGDCPDQLTEEQWLCYKLHRKMEVAEAQAEAYAVLIVRKHMPEQWTAAMTFLERRHPDRWRKRQTLENVEGTSVNDGIDEDALIEDPEALALLHDALEQVQQKKEQPTLPAAPSGVADELA